MTDSQPEKPLTAQPEPGEEQGQPQVQSPQPETSQPAEIPHPVEGPEQRPPESIPTEQDDRRQKRDHSFITDWIMAVATIGILIATVVNVCVAYRQWLAMQSQLIEIKNASEDTKDAIAASNRLAKASEDANLLRQDSDRAFMYAAPSRVFHVAPGHDLQSYITVGNSGATIAKKVERWAGVRVMPPPGTDAINDLMPMMSREEGVLVVSPRVLHNIIRQLPNRKELTKQDVDAIMSGQKRIYVFGLITYSDTFGKAHRTEFCFMYYGHEHAIYPDTGPGYFETQGQYCNKHNETDPN